MKKAIILAALGVAATAATSKADGFVTFSSYGANDAAGATTTLYGLNGPLLGAGYTAALYYALGSVSDPVNFGSDSSLISIPTGLTLYTGVNATAGYASSAPDGYFNGGTVQIPGYTTGAITFEVVAYSGADYTSSLFRARSGSFTMNNLPTTFLAPAPYLGDSANGQAMPNFFIPIPEPSTFALLGLGGVGMLVAHRRKKA